MSRDPESVRFEVDYWRAVLVDLAALHAAMPAIAQELANASVGMVSVVVRAGESESSEPVRAAISAAMQQVADAQQVVIRLGDLAGGRVQAIRRELDGEPEDGR